MEFCNAVHTLPRIMSRLCLYLHARERTDDVDGVGDDLDDEEQFLNLDDVLEGQLNLPTHSVFHLASMLSEPAVHLL